MSEEEAKETADCLHLHIMQCSCSCGNKWQHSNLWLASRKHGYLGGTPDPQQATGLPLVQVHDGGNGHQQSETQGSGQTVHGNP